MSEPEEESLHERLARLLVARFPDSARWDWLDVAVVALAFAESAETTSSAPRVDVRVNASRTSVDTPTGEEARLRLADMDRTGTVLTDNVEEGRRGSD
jgi:hypothetical protein